MIRGSNASKEAAPSGLIFNIQRYSLHDGPGIRTTIFLKGCPLHCEWCSNPEGINPWPELMIFDTKCIACFRCVEACPTSSICEIQGKRVIDRGTCNSCFDCVAVCPSGALVKTGTSYSVEEILEEIEKDRLFFINSGGGITFSGGEPLLQADFTREVFKKCRQKAIHTALDTTGHVSWETMKKVLECTDLVLYDIKHMDSAVHKKATDFGNQLILKNFKKTAKMVRTWVRIPLIPGFNDSEEFIKRLCGVILELGEGKIEKISLLPYHSWGEQKYEKLGRAYAYGKTSSDREVRLDELKAVIGNFRIPVTVGN
jgi:pyruvate formate lyase activating enzyme